MEQLNVYLCNRLAGILQREPNGALTFRYLPEYIASDEATPLSGTLPLEAEPFGERDIAAFFSNLLPDESVRRRIADILRLSPEDTFGLLREIGCDCAGAIAFYEPPGKIARTFTRAGIGESVVMDAISRQCAFVKDNLPALVDEANATHPSAIYLDIVQGIHRRIRQLNV